MMLRFLACLFLLSLVLLAPGVAGACGEQDCDREAVTGGVASTADDCCTDRCPAGDDDSECPPRCSFCSCCPGAGHVMAASPDVATRAGEAHAFVRLARAQRTATTPQHVFRPPR